MKKWVYLMLGGFIVSIPLYGQWWVEETQYTNNSIEDRSPDVDFGMSLPSTITWVSDSSVYYAYWIDTIWGAGIKLNPPASGINKTPSINYENIVWQGYTNNEFNLYYKVLFSCSLYKLVSSFDSISNPRASTFYYLNGNTRQSIVWEQFDGNDYEICFIEGIYNQSSISWGKIDTFTNNSYDDRHPSIGVKEWYNGVFRDSIVVAWEQFDGNDYEIICRVWDGVWDSVVQLTNDSTDDRFPCVAEGDFYYPEPSTIVWQQWDGNDYEICMKKYGGGSIWGPETLMTNNTVNDEKPVMEYGEISAGYAVIGALAWQRFDGNDYEIRCIVENEYLSWESDTQISKEDSFDDINPRLSMCPP